MSEPIGRIRFMDAQRVNLDGFAVEDPELGLTASRAKAASGMLIASAATARSSPCAAR